MASTPPTRAELLDQRNEIDRQIAMANLDGLKAALAGMKAGKVATLADDLQAIMPQLTPEPELGSAYNQVLNVISVVRNVAGFLDREVTRVQAIVDAQDQS
ncbi:hypothetical protein [Sphingobium sp. CCH11-B1]|jgi:hypothetical protein|uniref:hypothetical protein n=1 Tax=Sphingobium sp. CCH11-B1 TaxID=1768781 RepID=UPI0008310C13|nr:hypothetical protein [Sphingobium sp. CCH11-B1]